MKSIIIVMIQVLNQSWSFLLEFIGFSFTLFLLPLPTLILPAEYGYYYMRYLVSGSILSGVNVCIFFWLWGSPPVGFFIFFWLGIFRLLLELDKSCSLCSRAPFTTSEIRYEAFILLIYSFLVISLKTNSFFYLSNSMS